MEDIDNAISTLQELIRCTDRDEVRKLKIKFEDLPRPSEKESLNLEGMSSIHQLNEETMGLVQKVKKLSTLSIFPEGIALDLFEDRRGDILPAPKLTGETTVIRNMEKILGMINGDVRKIGVYGMGGIGKTTVMKHINNHIIKEQKDTFNCVIWVTVSKESSVFKLQDDIGRNLNIDLPKYEDTTRRAGALFRALKQKGRYLLILDDLWEGYPLEDVGIPDPDDPDSTNGCKLVLTTRSFDVCRTMKCEAIKMDLLSKEEALSLFLDHVGGDVLCFKDLEPIVRDVASECGHLPLAIATIATSMRGEKEACEWRVALTKLRASSKEPGDKGKKVIEQLKFSYDRLENKKLQKCLLLCALYPEDEKIERGPLVELLALEGIIEEMEFKRDEIDEGNVMLNNLINQCLLECGKTYRGDPWVKMHDLVRDMALQIDSQCLAISATELKKSSHVKKMKDILRIHISNCYSLKVTLICSRLTTIILQDFGRAGIPHSFFEHFKALKVLSLSGCYCLEVLPNSIFDLINLVGLLLGDYFLVVPCLAKLKNLRSLDLSLTTEGYDTYEWNLALFNNQINVPEGLDELGNLRYLNLMSYPMKMFPAGIIPSLSNLRHLVCSQFTNVCARELMGLKNLEMFKGAFHDIHDLCVYVKHREKTRSRLTSYTFIGGLIPEYLCIDFDAYSHNCFDKVVILINNNLGKSPANNDLYLLPKDVQWLKIENVDDLTSLCALASLNYATDLQRCEIRDCNGVKELVSSSSSYSFVFPSLRILYLRDLEKMEALIGRKKILCNVFPCLQHLDIYNCGKMKVVFNIGMLSNLSNLMTLTVRFCSKLEDIMGESLDDDKDVNEATTDIVLPKLRALDLFALSNLKSVCLATRRLICKSLKKLDIKDCPKLEQLCLYAPLDDTGQPSPSASLQRIELKREENEALDLLWG